jgi:stage V sporulation protein G
VEITEVRIKLMEDQQERLQAFCSITFDHCFVIRDLKIIEGTKGSLTDRCPRCGTKNHLRAGFCNQCGAQLSVERAGKDDDGRAKLYADIAHPINSRCREMIQSRVLTAFHEEQVRSRQPGYICSYDDYGEDRYADLCEMDHALPETRYAENGAVRRIEPAASAVNSPHLVPAAERRDIPHAVGTHEEGFGAGIL